jgi:hypothetical protein
MIYVKRSLVGRAPRKKIDLRAWDVPLKADIRPGSRHVRFVQPAQPVDATLALNLSPCRAAWQ